jgi:ATP-dependent Lon protease
MDYDLSKVFFITTANRCTPSPAAAGPHGDHPPSPATWRRRRKKIASDFLLPKQLKQHGLKPENLSMSDGAILEIIRRYTRESGCATGARAGLGLPQGGQEAGGRGDMDKAVSVTKSMLQPILGVPKVRTASARRRPRWRGHGPGLDPGRRGAARGGGGAHARHGQGRDHRQAWRRHAGVGQGGHQLHPFPVGVFRAAPDFYKEVDIHIHVPEGPRPRTGRGRASPWPPAWLRPC